MEIENQDKILNIKELSDYLHCSKSTIRNLIYNNKIPYFKIQYRYYFNLSIINKWVTNLYNDIEIGDYNNEIGGNTYANTRNLN